MTASETRPIAVLKIGGSVFTDLPAYQRAARFVSESRAERTGCRIAVVVSAEHGQTDALEATARAFAAAPDPAMLDLLWSTGEHRSVALLTMALQKLGVRATGANVHQAGLSALDTCVPPAATSVRPRRLLRLLASHDVVVVPGFLASAPGDGIVSLGRGSSDLTAVLLADALGASTCELVKDVDGYYTADPNHDPHARHLPQIGFGDVLAMADRGCGLLQRAAIERARERGITLVLRAIGSSRRTVVGAAENLPVAS